MNTKVLVTKAEFFRILGASAISFALFVTSDAPEAKAIRFIFDSVDDFDLNDDLVTQTVIPLLLANGALTQQAVDRVEQYKLVSLYR